MTSMTSISSNNSTISLFPITQSSNNYNNCINVFSGQSVVAPTPTIRREKNYNNCINGEIFLYHSMQETKL